MGTGSGGSGPAKKPPEKRLPKGTPKDIVDFVSCKKDKVTLKGGKSPIKIDLGVTAAEPTIEFTDDGKGGVDVKLTIGDPKSAFSLSKTLKGKVNSEGQLEVDTSQLPVGKDKADEWIKDFNDQVKKGGKKLGPPKVAGGDVTFEKVAIAAAGGGTKKKRKRARRVAAGLVTTAIVGTGVGLVATSGSDDDAGPDAPAGQSADPGTGGEGFSPDLVGSGRSCGTPGDRRDVEAAVDAVSGTPVLDPWGALASRPGECGGFAPEQLADSAGPYSPRPGAFTVPIIGPPAIDISHRAGVEDAVTGEVGRSSFRFLVETNFPGVAGAQVSARCSGQTVTGAGRLRGGAVQVDVPLFQFGPCSGLSGTMTFSDGGTLELPIGDVEFTVGPEEGPVEGFGASDSYRHLIDTYGDNESFGRHLESLAFIRSLLTGVITHPDPVPWEGAGAGRVEGDSASDLPLFFGQPEVIGAGAVDPTQAFADSLAAGAWAAEDAVPPLFNESVFPCGSGPYAFTVCAPGGPDFPEGDAFLGQVALDQPVLLDADDFTLRFETDADARWEAHAESGEWSVTGDAGDTTARVLIRNNSVSLVAPASEADGVTGLRVTVLSGDRGTVVPSADGFVPVGAEPLPVFRDPGSPRRFAIDLVAALRGRDADFLLAHLHPNVVGIYGADACRAQVRSFDSPLGRRGTTVGRARAPERFDYSADNVTFSVDDSVPVEVTPAGGPRQTIHVALADGDWRWFTDCGQPLGP